MEGGLPSTYDDDTIYAVTDNGETEIEKLIIRGMEFVGGGAAPGTPAITKPSGTTLNLGMNTGSGVSKTIEIKANSYITGDITVGLASNSGLSFDTSNLPSGVTYNSGDGTLTIAQASAIQGVNITIVYSGSGDAEIDGGLVISGGGASPKSLVVVVADPYAGFIFDKAMAGTSNTNVSMINAEGYCVSPALPMVNGHNYKIRMGFKDNSVRPKCTNGQDAQGNSLLAFTTANADSNGYRTINLNNAECVQCVMTCFTANLDTCYLYDVTAGQYVFRGVNANESLDS